MLGASVIAAMRIALKNNKRARKNGAIVDIDSSPLQKIKINTKKASAEELETIKLKMEAQKKMLLKRKIMVLSMLIILGISFFIFLFTR